MAEIVNLRRIRKQRQRKEKASQSAENRVRYGRTKTEKAAEELRTKRRSEALDGHKLTDDPPDSA